MKLRQLLFLFLTLGIVLNACVSNPPPATQTCYDEPSVQQADTATLAPADTSLGYVRNQILIQYHQPLTTLSTHESLQAYLSTAATVQNDYSLQLLEAGDTLLPDLIEVPETQDFEAVLEQLNADPRVAYVEPNYYLHTLSLPSDLYVAEQWHLTNFGLEQAWARETGKDTITVAVIDTGVDLQHEDLQGRLLPGCDFYNQDNDPAPGPPTLAGRENHGTHVAGIVAANGNNNKGIAGVAYTGVNILAVRVFDDTGDAARALDVAKAIRWSAGLNVPDVNKNPYPARIINLSIGTSSDLSNTLANAVTAARNAGSLVIAAAGNNGSSSYILAPASSPDALAVGSVNHDYERSSFSNYNENGVTVALMAPGGMGPNHCGSVLSSINGSQYDCMAGTSMAAPFVAGVAALIWSQNPTWTVDQVEQWLLDATYSHPDWNSQEYGAGVLCADRALGASTLCGQ